MTLSISSTSANYQSVDLIPLITMITEDDRVLNFQFTDRETVAVQGTRFQYLAGRIDNVAGSAIPFGGYRYRMSIDNGTSSIFMNERALKQNTEPIDSLLGLIDQYKGLRGTILAIYFFHPSNERANRQSIFMVDQTTVGDGVIVFDLLNAFNENIRV